MASEMDHEILYPTKEDIFRIHSDIVNEDDEASEGILDGGSVEFALDCIRHGHYGHVPETLHEKAVELLRLLSANHAFADGNKRTALNSTWTFYAMNGYYFDYGEEIKAILKMFAVMERMVDKNEAVEYFEDIALKSDHPDVPSEVVQMMHLSKWDTNIQKRFSTLVDEYEPVEGHSGENIDEIREEMTGLIKERNQLVESFIEFRDEHSNHLNDELVEHIDTVIHEWEDITNFLTELTNGAEKKKEIVEIADRYGLSGE